MENYRDEILVHFGVPGMKWGHRKQQPNTSDGNRVSSKKKISTGVKIAGAVLVAGATYGLAKKYKITPNKVGQNIGRIMTESKIKRTDPMYGAVLKKEKKAKINSTLNKAGRKIGQKMTEAKIKRTDPLYGQVLKSRKRTKALLNKTTSLHNAAQREIKTHNTLKKLL